MANLLIYALSMLCALVIAGGAIAFLFRQKTVVDDKGNVTHVEIPLFGKIQSNYPSVGICLIGAGLAVYTISKVDPPRETIELSTKFEMLSDAGLADVPPLLAAVPQDYLRTANLEANGSGSLSFNVDRHSNYTVFIFKLTEVTADGTTRYSISRGTPVAAEDKLSFKAVLK